MSSEAETYSQLEIAEAEIRAALARGEENSDDVRERKGKPIDLDAYFATPPELRMSFSVLKEGDLVPEELELLKEINRLEDQVASAGDEKTRSALRPEALRTSRRLRHEDARLPAHGPTDLKQAEV